MTPTKVLQSLGLERYLAAFESNGINAEMLLTLTDADLKELGIAKLGDRKRFLAAIEKLRAGDPALDAFCQAWPAPIAVPLREYVVEIHPVAKLWAACDTVEMLLRLLVIARVAERAREDSLPEPLRRRLAEVIETPTLGAWFLMAQALAEKDDKEPLLAKADAFIDIPLRDLLYGPSKPGTPETSFLRLRNRMAHGGGLTQKEAARLMGLWQEKFQQTLHAAAFLKDWELLGRDEAGIWRRLRGPDGREESAQPPQLGGDQEADAVWLRKNDRALLLWPLLLFGKPASEAENGRRVGPEDKAQVYSRRDSVRLTYTPLGMEGMAQSESGPSALEAFETLFRVERSREQAGFKVADFLRDIHKDAAQMVGRQRELEQVQAAIHATEQGVLWLSGSAGMGKSFLMAKLAADLLEEHHGSRTLVLPYRFRLGDQGRCSREGLAQFTVERLQAAGVLKDVFQNKQDAKAEQRLEQALGLIKDDVRVVMLLDGLDEVVRRDEKFVEQIPLGLRFPRVLWVCAGRPEAGIEAAMRRLAAQTLFPEGLPPMRREGIRGMILEKIGPLRKRLLAQDREKGDTVVNPFIELVTQRAAGLPLYVRYVIGDVLNGKYRVLDGQEDLPASLHAYHEELLRRLGVGDLQAVITPLAATLACAYEPLALQELEALFVWRKLVRAGDGRELIQRGLAAIASMITTAPDPEGETGYTLFHQSLRDHILGSAQMAHGVATAKDAFADIAVAGDKIPKCLQTYSVRCGVDHLLVVGRKADAERLLLDLAFFAQLDRLGYGPSSSLGLETLCRWWKCLDCETFLSKYIPAVRSALEHITEENAELVLDQCDLISTLGFWCEAASSNYLTVVRMTAEASENVLGLDRSELRLANLGYALLSCHLFQDAALIFQRLFKFAKSKYGMNCYPQLLYETNLVVALKRCGDLAGALAVLNDREAWIRHIIDEREHSFGMNNPKTLKAIEGLADHYRRQREHSQAEQIYLQLLARHEEGYGVDGEETLRMVEMLAFFYEECCKTTAADGLFQRLIAASVRQHGRTDSTTVDRVKLVAMVLAKRGDFCGAVQQLLDFANSSSYLLIQFRAQLARYQCLKGNLDEAKRLITEEIAAKPAAREQALEDDDLKAIWGFIRNLPENAAN
jgi:tetratricopeptide (TPR) repeat protein